MKVEGSQSVNAKTAKRILIVEDEPAAREATRRYLEYCGYDVDSAATATQAMEKAEIKHPHVLVCDCRLGNSNDGIEAARAIQQRFGAAVIFVTAYSSNDLRAQLQDIDVVACLRKPISLSTLARVVGAGIRQ